MAEIHTLSLNAIRQVDEVVRRVLRDGGSTAFPPRPQRAGQRIVDAIEYVITTNEAGTPLGVGEAKPGLEIPFACSIQAARMVADQSTTTTVDIWMDTFANYPPTNADSITAAAPLAIGGGLTDEDTTLTGWTRAIPAGSWLAFNIDANDNAEQLTVSLTVFR